MLQAYAPWHMTCHMYAVGSLIVGSQPDVYGARDPLALRTFPAFNVCDKVLDRLGRGSVVQAAGGVFVAFLAQNIALRAWIRTS